MSVVTQLKPDERPVTVKFSGGLSDPAMLIFAIQATVRAAQDIEAKFYETTREDTLFGLLTAADLLVCELAERIT